MKAESVGWLQAALKSGLISFYVLMAATVHIAVFWVTTLCSLVGECRCFGRTLFLNL
jgi:hypothetical protein